MVYIFVLNSETLLHFTTKQFCQIALMLKHIHSIFRLIMAAIYNFREMKWGIYDLTKIPLHPLMKHFVDFTFGKIFFSESALPIAFKLQLQEHFWVSACRHWLIHQVMLWFFSIQGKIYTGPAAWKQSSCLWICVCVTIVAWLPSKPPAGLLINKRTVTILCSAE